MDFGPRSWAAARLDGACLDLLRPHSGSPATCYQTIDPQPSRVPPTRRASRFLLDICCWVPRSPCSHNNPASNDNYYPSFSGRQQRSGKASPQTESIHPNPLSNQLFVKDARSANTHPLSHCITSRTTRHLSPPCPAPTQKFSPESPKEQKQRTTALRFPATNSVLSLSTQSPAMADATNTNDELYPIAVLIDELKVWR
jgi:hypothetical protein